MLQIKKNGKLITSKYNLQFLFRNKTIASKYLAKKKVTHSITLRAPKNFNIGKNKILNLNYMTNNLILKSRNNVTVSSLLNSSSFFYICAKKRIKLTPTLIINSIRFTVKTKFKLMWLGTLFFF